ncbi:hypothetical protein HQ487_04475 [Candidatus Uhrbacteria bacterium]|nr:hypothetical protein [Candidatus Uhrbacteria bacterium]
MAKKLSSNRFQQAAVENMNFHSAQRRAQTSAPSMLLRNQYQARMQRSGSNPSDQDMKAAEDALIRIHSKSGSTELFEKEICNMALRLRQAAGGNNAFVICLAEAESHRLCFDNLDHAIEIFNWIVEQTQTRLSAKPASGSSGLKKKRVQHGKSLLKRTQNFWNTVISACCKLFGYFQDHWMCSSNSGSAPTLEIFQSSVEILCSLGWLLPPCRILNLVESAQRAGIAPDTLKPFLIQHHPRRTDDFEQLILDGLLNGETYWELVTRPELVTALSYQGLKLLLGKWKESETPQDLLAFARSMKDEFYPDGLPKGGEVIEWNQIPRTLIGFLNALDLKLKETGVHRFNFGLHTCNPGTYTPVSASILLEEPEGLPDASEDLEPYDEDETDLHPNSNEELTPFESEEPEDQNDHLLDGDVLDLWVENAAIQMELSEHPLLFNEEEDPPSSTENPWVGVLAQIERDVRESQGVLEDPQLARLLDEIGGAEMLIALAVEGDAPGVLDLWHNWHHLIRNGIREAEARVQELETRVKELEARPPVIETVFIHPPAVDNPEPPALIETPLKLSTFEDLPPSPPATQESLELPEGPLGELLQKTYDSLAQLPSGAMKRQIKSQLEELRVEALEGGNPRSLGPRIRIVEGEIEEFLDMIS